MTERWRKRKREKCVWLKDGEQVECGVCREVRGERELEGGVRCSGYTVMVWSGAYCALRRALRPLLPCLQSGH